MLSTGLLEPEAARDMRAWESDGGFSVDASIRVEADDRAGLERWLSLLCETPFCPGAPGAHPGRGEALVYRLPKPLPNGKTQLRLTPLELLGRLAVLIPPPRVHRHRYHGVLAPNAPWRAQATAMAADTTAQALPEAAPSPPPGGSAQRAAETVHRTYVSSLWAAAG